MAKKYDFKGWATKNNTRCGDGRIIRKNAFIDNDGNTVPLFWNHQHNDPEMVLGHALLMNKEDGVYAEGYFNNSPKAQHVKDSIKHGDLFALSIYANQLKQVGDDVIHGLIRELSVVPAGANPGALIENAQLAHGDFFENDDESMLFFSVDENILAHSAMDEDDEEEEDDKKKKKAEPEDEDSEADTEEVEDEEEEKKAKKSEEDDEEEEKEMKHSDTDNKTVGDVLKTLNEDQKKAVAVLIDAISNDDDEEDEDDAEEETEEEESVKHNVFEANEGIYGGPVLSHSDMVTIFEDWKRTGSLKETIKNQLNGGVLAHSVTNADGSTQTYGIADIDYLFPDAKTINPEPDFISRQMDWVKVVMNGTRHTPFSRVKSIHANITMDEARAKGYVKGARKADEVFSLLKRVTTPQTIYKKQKLDRDDINDIVDFNVVAWIKQEMRLMLEEECARAILIGDGRSAASSDKISEEHIRPVAKDNELYTIKVVISDDTDSAKVAKNLITNTIKARKNYKGSGVLTMFTTAEWHTEMVLLEDAMGRPLYDTDDKLATKLRVNSIVDVEPMEGQTDSDGNELMAILVDLRDYNVGADKGGATEFFEDFDIDYNQEKYLLETRFSGALVKPYSAIAIYKGSTTTEP